jgi:hypothetical protein
MNDAEYWKKVAMYLAQCHAGTMEGEARLKHTSRSSRERFRSICVKSASMLGGQWPQETFLSTNDVQHVIDRLNNAIKP